MKQLTLCLVLCSAAAIAQPVEVPVGGRTPLRPNRAIDEITVRDPSLVTVVVTDGAVSLEGVKSGVSAVLLTYESGELEHALVVIGDSTPSKGPRLDRPQTVDLRPLRSATAHAKPPDPPAKAKARRRDAL